MAKKTSTKSPGRIKRFFKTTTRWVSLPFIILVVAVGLPLMLDENGYYESSKQEAQIREMKKEIKTLRDSIEYYRAKTRAIDTRPEMVERVAREQFRMKRPNEDLFITEIK